MGFCGKFKKKKKRTSFSLQEVIWLNYLIQRIQDQMRTSDVDVKKEQLEARGLIARHI